MEKVIYTRSTTIIDVLFGVRHAGLDIALVFTGALLTALAAQVVIPWQPVPFTLQTFSVLMCGLVLGSKRALASMALYLTAGAAGFPVFAKASGGLGILGGPTAGYLMGFLIAGGILGYLAERKLDRYGFILFLALLVVSSIILGLGVLWLSKFLGIEKAFQVGVLPFLGGELLKIAAVMLIYPLAWKGVSSLKGSLPRD